jgi:phage terminase large subunit-like protein
MDINQSLNDLEYNRKWFKIQFFNPYEYQKQFYELKGSNGKLAKARCLKAGNKIGKTLCEGVELSWHATGNYPEWWQGHRVNKNPNIVCSGKNSYKTRDLIQKELLGTSDKDIDPGTGWIPKHLIHDITRKPGIPGAAEKIYVKRNNGTELSCIVLFGYEDGIDKFMGDAVDYGWCDEEPPIEIWSQFVRGTIATEGALALTYTPEMGMTDLTYRFQHDCPPNYAMLEATWDDAPHLTPARREELLAEMMPYEREMRSKGIAIVGDSVVFPVSDDDITCDPFEIPKKWPQIIGVDFGGDHPFAVVKLAFDPNGIKKKAYVIDCTKSRRLTVSQEASIIKGMGGNIIPVAWPHDGNKLDKESGKPSADLYRKEGVKMLEKCFSNPSDSYEENTGGQGVEVGLKKMYWAMTEGRFKVFRNLPDWFKEKNAYHRKFNQTTGESSVVRKIDDLMSATRYAYMSALTSDDHFRFAKPLERKDNFSRDIKYNLAFVK